jgi:methylmalonyl-CoA mutase cobalamin-binding domain/chain
MTPRAVRILFASDTSGHTVGYHVVARGFRDAGFEVIVAGRLLPDEAVKAATEEGADLLAIRIMDRDPLEYVTALYERMRAIGAEAMPVLVGGIVAKRDAEKLREMGVVGVFRPGSKLADIVACVRTVATPGG